MFSRKDMFRKNLHFVILLAVFLQWRGVTSFFVKELRHGYRRGRCINDTGQIQSSGSWGSLFFLQLSYGSCLDPSAQFRFRDNGAMLNLEKQGCLAAFDKNVSGYSLDMFYLYVDSVSLDTAACAQKPSEGIYRAISQTSNGGLSVYYKGKHSSSFRTWYAARSYYYHFGKNYGETYFIGLTRFSFYNHRYIFGSVTCCGKMVKNANCPKDQYMVVKIASFRGLLGTKTCGLSDDYSSEVDVTCLVKKKCDGLHECGFTVDGSFVSGDLCPGLSNYLYFEYQCIDTLKPYKGPCAPSGPPLNIKTTSRSASTLLVTWDPPAKTKQNGIIISYTACISHSENGFCFQRFISRKNKWLIIHLNASTKYYTRVLASTKVGQGNYSESKGYFTNGRPAEKATSETSSTLTFSLTNPSNPFVYFYVVVLKLHDCKELPSPDNYQIDDLVSYAEARYLTARKPYIAAVITSSGVDGNIFVLGDRRNTYHPARQNGRSNIIRYFNGPLEPGNSYSIFQRIIINDEGDYYSTDWSPASKTIRITGQQVLGRNENNEGPKKYLAGVIVLIIALVILCAVIVCLVYQTRFKSPSTDDPRRQTTNDQTNSSNIYDMPLNNYENVEDPSTYTAQVASERPAALEEPSDDHVYDHLYHRVYIQ